MIYGHAIGGGGGGKSGATLTVTAPVGSTVTVSKGSESYSSALLPAVFKGLSTGTWVVSYTNGPDVGQSEVNITADYAITVAYFGATINIAYPSGSVCTATNGDITLTAPDTSGAWTCRVPTAGTWTVTATDGTDTATETVEITVKGQNAVVELGYWHGDLYNLGDEFTVITGGWSGTGAGRHGINADGSILMVGTNDDTSGYWFTTNNKIDLSDFTTLKMNVSAIGVDRDGRSKMGIHSTSRTSFSSSVGATNTGVFSLDIRNISGEHYVGLSTNNNGDFTVSRIWME